MEIAWLSLMEWKHLSSHEEDVVLNVMDAGGDDGQRHAGENVGIVTLTRVKGLAVVGHRQERRTAGKNSFSLKEAINFKWIGYFVCFFSRKTTFITSVCL